MRKPMVDKKYLQTVYSISLSTINRRLDEFEVEIAHHRYPAAALIRDTAVRIDPDVFESFMLERRKLRSGAKRRARLRTI